MVQKKAERDSTGVMGSFMCQLLPSSHSLNTSQTSWFMVHTHGFLIIFWFYSEPLGLFTIPYKICQRVFVGQGKGLNFQCCSPLVISSIHISGGAMFIRAVREEIRRPRLQLDEATETAWYQVFLIRENWSQDVKGICSRQHMLW